jgi:hypothetical protein
MFGAVNPMSHLPPSRNIAPIQDAAVVRDHPETGNLSPRSAEMALAAVLDHRGDNRKPLHGTAPPSSRSTMTQSRHCPSSLQCRW